MSDIRHRGGVQMAKAHNDVGIAADTTTTLLDGATVTLRQLRRGDYDDVIALATDLSVEERYLRFFTAHPGYIGEWALSLTAPAAGVVALGVLNPGN
jgi:hypothetical protein